MDRECDVCGQTFDTLTAFRLHECADQPRGEKGEVGVDATEPSDDTGALRFDATDPGAATGEVSIDDIVDEEHLEEIRGPTREERRERATKMTDDELDAAIDRARGGDSGAAVTAIARFDRELEAALDHDRREAYRDVFWGYYHETVDAVDAVALEEGWPFLLDLASAYDHRQAAELTEVTGAIANVLARGVIRTRLTEDVAEIPGDALAYLYSVPDYDTDSFEIAWEEAMHCGWGIGHPAEDVESAILDQLPGEDSWACGAARDALYVDQTAAVSMYTELLRTNQARGLAANKLGHLEGEPTRDIFPRGSNFPAEFDRDLSFTFEAEVERQLRATFEEVGLDENLPEEWSFEDFELLWG